MFGIARATLKTAMPILAAASLFLMPSVATASEVMTVCTARSAVLPAAASGGDFQLAHLLAASSAQIKPFAGNAIALTRDENGFDLIVGWRQSGEHSLRAAGVEVMGTDLGGLIDLMVFDASQNVVHYVFSLDANGAGDMLSNDDADLGDQETSSFGCRNPR